MQGREPLVLSPNSKVQSEVSLPKAVVVPRGLALRGLFAPIRNMAMNLRIDL